MLFSNALPYQPLFIILLSSSNYSALQQYIVYKTIPAVKKSSDIAIVSERFSTVSGL